MTSHPDNCMPLNQRGTPRVAESLQLLEVTEESSYTFQHHFIQEDRGLIAFVLK